MHAKVENSTVAEVWSGEYWAKKGNVKLYVYRKRAKAPRKGEKPLPVLFLVHGSSMSGRSGYDLQVPGRSDYSLMDHFAGLGFDLPVVNPRKISCPVLIIRGEYDGIAAEPDLMRFFDELPSKDKQFVFVSGMAHNSTLGINRHKVRHVMQAFLQLPENRALAA